jgi:hypothetical protein
MSQTSFRLCASPHPNDGDRLPKGKASNVASNSSLDNSDKHDIVLEVYNVKVPQSLAVRQQYW